MSNTTVLVVDDSKVSRMMITAIIRDLRADWTIIEAASGDDALQASSGKEIDLCIIDYNMPSMDGLTLATKLKETFPQIPMSLLTANVQESTQLKAESIGVVFTRKPITEERIISILNLVN